MSSFDDSFISKKTGRVLAGTGQVLVGDSNNIATPSYKLMDLEIDVKTLFQERGFLDEIRHLEDKLVKVKNGRFIEATLGSGKIWIGVNNKPVEVSAADAGIAENAAKYIIVDRDGLGAENIPNAYSLKDEIAPLLGTSMVKVDSSGYLKSATGGVDYVSLTQYAGIQVEFAGIATHLTAIDTYIAALAGFTLLSDLTAFLAGVGISSTAKNYADYIKGLTLSIKNTWKSTDFNDEGHLATGDFQMFDHGYYAANRGQGGAIFFDSKGREAWWGDDIHNPNNSESGIRVISWDSDGDVLGRPDSPLAPVYMGVFGYRNTQNLGFVQQRTQRGIILRAEFHQTAEKGDDVFRYPMIYGMYDVDRDLSTRNYDIFTDTIRYGWSYRKALWEYRPFDGDPAWDFKVKVNCLPPYHGENPVTLFYFNEKAAEIKADYMWGIDNLRNELKTDYMWGFDQVHGRINNLEDRVTEEVATLNTTITDLEASLITTITNGDTNVLNSANAFAQNKVDLLNISVTTKLNSLAGDVGGVYNNLKLAYNIDRTSNTKLKLVGDVNVNYELNGLNEAGLVLSRITKAPEIKSGVTTYYTGYGDSYKLQGVNDLAIVEFSYTRQDGVKKILFDHQSEEVGATETNALIFRNPIEVLQPENSNNPITLEYFANNEEIVNKKFISLQSVQEVDKLILTNQINENKNLCLTNGEVIYTNSKKYTDIKVKAINADYLILNANVQLLNQKTKDDLSNDIIKMGVLSQSLSNNYTNLKVKNTSNRLVSEIKLGDDKLQNEVDKLKVEVSISDKNVKEAKALTLISTNHNVNQQIDSLTYYLLKKVKTLQTEIQNSLSTLLLNTLNEIKTSAESRYIEHSALIYQLQKKVYVLENSTGEGGGATIAYVDTQDALMLALAKAYADDRDAVMLQLAKDYTDEHTGGEFGVDLEKFIKIVNHQDGELDYHPDSLMSEINTTTDLVRVRLKEGNPRFILQGDDVELKLEHKNYSGYSIGIKKTVGNINEFNISYKNYNGVNEKQLGINNKYVFSKKRFADYDENTGKYNTYNQGIIGEYKWVWSTELILLDQWLLCDGRFVPKADYPELWALGVHTGDDGEGNFRLPDAKGFVMAMPDGTYANQLGAYRGSSILSDVPAHTHTMTQTSAYPSSGTVYYPSAVADSSFNQSIVVGGNTKSFQSSVTWNSFNRESTHAHVIQTTGTENIDNRQLTFYGGNLYIKARNYWK